MACRLINAGHQVTIVCGNYDGGNTGLVGSFKHGKREGKVKEINIIEYNLSYSNSDSFLKRTFLFLIFAAKGVGIALTSKYDLIFASSTPLTAAIPGVIGRWIRGKQFIFEVRDLWPELPKAMGVITNPFLLICLTTLERISYRSAHRCIGLSPGIVEGINLKGVSKDKIALIPNGCDLDIFHKKHKVWRPHNVNSNDFMAIYSGTHGLANGLEVLIEVAKELKSRGNKKIKIVLIGDGKLKISLQNKVNKLNLDNIIFHKPVDKYKLSSLMSTADLGLQLLANVPAFYYGTSPNKFFDYISSGLPVLNNYPGWLANLIKDNECGFEVPPNNPKVFADTLEYASNNIELMKNMGMNSRKLAESSFDRNKLANKWLDWVVEAKR